MNLKQNQKFYCLIQWFIFRQTIYRRWISIFWTNCKLITKICWLIQQYLNFRWFHFKLLQTFLQRWFIILPKFFQGGKPSWTLFNQSVTYPIMTGLLQILDQWPLRVNLLNWICSLGCAVRCKVRPACWPRGVVQKVRFTFS